MKRAIRVFLWVGIAALSLAPWAVAQNVTLTSAGSNVADGIYVSPYYATVNGATNTPIVCDDFADNSYLNTPWTANVQSFSSLSSSLANTAWGGVPGALKLYEEAAWLTMTLLRQPAGSAGQVNYSYAVWAVFDPSGVINQLKLYGDTATCNAIFGAGNNCSSTTVTGGLLGGAQGQSYSLSQFANVVILTPVISVNGKPQTCTAGGCPEQEFIELVPEGGAAMAYLLLASVCCFGAMFLRSRRLGSISAA
jgi:hypothetical protein